MSDVLWLNFWFWKMKVPYSSTIPPSPSACSITQTQLYQCLLSQHLFFALLLLLCKSYLYWADLCITIIFPFLYNLISHLLSFPYHYHYLFLHSPTELKSLRTSFSMWSNTSLSLSIGNSLPLDVTLLVTLSLGCMGWCSPGATSVLRLPSSSLLWWILFSWLCILLLGYTFISVDLILLQLPKDGCAGSEIAAILQSWRCLSLFFNVLFYIRI